MQTQTPQDAKIGLAYALGAFLLWGLAPIYFKAVSSVSPFEVLAHRVVWSVAFLTFAIGVLKPERQAILAIRPKQLALLFFTAIVISINWLTFIWAVTENRILETSLGYYINPLVTVLLGVIFLGERLRKMQLVAIFLAALGVINQIIFVGYLPWVALALAFSFSFYGLVRKKVGIQPVAGLTVETLLMLPFALVYLYWLAQSDTLLFGEISNEMDILLVCAGLMTTVPLLLFASGNKRLSLTTIGLTQYLTPTMTFLLAIFAYNEAFYWQQMMTFALIWLGLVLFTAEGLHTHGKTRKLDPR